MTRGALTAHPSGVEVAELPPPQPLGPMTRRAIEAGILPAQPDPATLAWIAHTVAEVLGLTPDRRAQRRERRSAGQAR